MANGAIMNNIFVSYRRSDSSDVTGRIFDQLKARFGEERLFKDVDSIPLGRFDVEPEVVKVGGSAR